MEKTTNYNFIFNFLAGGTAGVIAKTVTAPIERVKLIIQTSFENDKIKKKYKGVTDCFIRCVREDGFWSLWRGNGVNVIRYFPTQALNFAFKDFFGSRINVYDKSEKGKFLMANILSGGLAGTCGNIFVYPLDFVRTRLGVDMGKGPEEREFKGMWDCMRKTYRNEGIRGLYRGFVIGAGSLFFYRGLYFGIYDSGKELLLKNYDSIWVRVLWAQATVIFAETMSYPGDTLKRKMMMQSLKAQKMYDNTWDCIKKTYKKQGLHGFWKGAFSNILRGIGSSICLVLYDQIQKIMGTNKKN